MFKPLTLLTTVGLLTLASSLAQAETRTFCFTLELVDSRSGCPTSGAGARRPCQGISGSSDDYTYAVGHKYELWDKDTVGDDEYIGTWVIGGEGSRCVTFEWDGASYAGSEADPDIYLKYINEVRATSGGQLVIGKDETGAAVANTTWRNGTTTNSDLWVAVDCHAGTDCWVTSTLIPTSDETSERGLRLMALDSAQHMLEIYGEMMTEDVELRFPDPSWSYATDRDIFYIFNDHGDDGDVAPHELGHVLQMQLFGQDYLRDVCGSSHSLTSVEAESCSTTEGWANYVGTIAWYDPQNSSVTPLFYGYNIEGGTTSASPYSSTCSANGDIELQVARGFWDLDDARAETGAGAAAGNNDVIAYTTEAVADGWTFFANGTGNRDDYESDDDGVNVKDFYYNTTGWFTTGDVYQTLLRHNCLQYQDYN